MLEVCCYHHWLICTIRHYFRRGEEDIQVGVEYKQTYTNTQTSPEDRVAVEFILHSTILSPPTFLFLFLSQSDGLVPLRERPHFN